MERERGVVVALCLEKGGEIGDVDVEVEKGSNEMKNHGENQKRLRWEAH